MSAYQTTSYHITDDLSAEPWHHVMLSNCQRNLLPEYSRYKMEKVCSVELLVITPGSTHTAITRQRTSRCQQASTSQQPARKKLYATTVCLYIPPNVLFITTLLHSLINWCSIIKQPNKQQMFHSQWTLMRIWQSERTQYQSSVPGAFTVVDISVNISVKLTVIPIGKL